MNRNLRIFLNSTDLTASLTDFVTPSATVALETSGAIFIGSPVPMNHLFFDMDVVNTNPATLSVDIWHNRAWSSAVDVIDETAGFTKSGRISWEVARPMGGWSAESESDDVTGLAGTNVYDFYWLKITTSANFSAGTKVNFVGQKFCTEADLTAVYTDLGNTNLKASIGTSNKWDRKILIASEMIVDDLVSKRIVWHPGQLLDWSRFKYPCIHKTAEIIYGSGMGGAFVDEKAEASKQYSRAISMGSFVVDRNGDGSKSRAEQRFSVTFAGR